MDIFHIYSHVFHFHKWKLEKSQGKKRKRVGVGKSNLKGILALRFSFKFQIPNLKIWSRGGDMRQFLKI